MQRLVLDLRACGRAVLRVGCVEHGGKERERGLYAIVPFVMIAIAISLGEFNLADRTL